MGRLNQSDSDKGSHMYGSEQAVFHVRNHDIRHDLCGANIIIRHLSLSSECL